jgi:hypothetical protein
VDQATLVNLDVDAGMKVLKALDTAKLKAAVALWAVLPEYSDWRLILSSPAFDQPHPLKAYEQVAKALHGNPISMRPSILILRMKDPFIKDLRRIFGQANDVTGMRLGGQTIGNRFISDAYVYRIQ